MFYNINRISTDKTTLLHTNYNKLIICNIEQYINFTMMINT